MHVIRLDSTHIPIHSLSPSVPARGTLNAALARPHSEIRAAGTGTARPTRALARRPRPLVAPAPVTGAGTRWTVDGERHRRHLHSTRQTPRSILGISIQTLHN